MIIRNSPLVSQTSEVVGVTQQEGEAAQQMKCHPPSRVQLPSPDEVQKEQRVSEPREYLRVHFSRRRSLIPVPQMRRLVLRKVIGDIHLQL